MAESGLAALEYLQELELSENFAHTSHTKDRAAHLGLLKPFTSPHNGTLIVF